MRPKPGRSARFVNLAVLLSVFLGMAGLLVPADAALAAVAGTMQIVVTPSATTFQSAGQVITYKYTLFHTGDSTTRNIFAPYAVTDTKVSGITCPATPASLAPMDSGVPGVTCTGIYTVTAADVLAGSISNGTITGTGHDGSTSGAIINATLSGTSTTTVTYSPLTVTNLSAPNLIIDSNKVNTGPSVFTAGAKYCNQGTVTLDNVFAKIGNGTTPGTFPVSACPTGTAAGGGIPQLNCGGSGGGAKPYTGNFALSMVDTTGQDASRYIGDLAPGQCKTVYWQIKYDRADAALNPLYGATGPTRDDIRWNYHLWATGNDSGTPRTAALKGYVVGRSEITASPNKINAQGSTQSVAPNPTGPGQIVTVTYNNVDFSGVGGGFDAVENSGAGDGVYDNDLWFQPIGSSGAWNTSTFRLSKVQVTLRGAGGASCGVGGAGLTFGRTDQWYFYHMDKLDASGNPDTGGTYSCSGWRGDYTYTFIALGTGSATLAPYQEASSGANNEKYNGDYCGDNPASDPAVCQIISSALNGNPTLAKSVDKATASAGENLTYTVTYANTIAGTTVGQPDSGLPVRVLDTIPANTAYVAGSVICPAPTPSPGAAPYCTVFYSTDNGTTWTDIQPSPASITTLRWDLSHALAGNTTGTVGFTVTSSPSYTGTTTNTATIHIADGPVLVSAQASTAVGVNPPTVSKAFSPTSIPAGGTSVLTITLTNPNAGAATLSANLVDTLPSGLTLANATFGGTCTGTKSGTTGGTSITYASGGTIPANGSCTITANVTGSVADSYVNTIAAGALQTDKGNNANPASDTLTVVAPTADLSITKTDGVTSVNAGGTTTYTITVTNSGPSEVAAAPVVDTAPTGLAFGSWSCAVTNAGSGGSVTTACGVASGTGNLNTTVTLKSGAVITYTVSATVSGTASGSLTNAATVSTPVGTTDPTPGNNSASDTDTVTPVADLSIVKTDGVTSVNAGGTTAYTLTVTNNGPSEVTAAPVVDTAPTGLAFGSWSCAVTNAGSGGSVTTACGAASGTGNLNTTVTLKSGAVITYTVSATVSGTASGSLTNAATVSTPAGTTDPTPGNNSASDTDTVQSTGAIGNRVWLDENGDGVQDPGEAGIANIKVELRDATGTTLVATTYTDSEGGYLFPNVPAGVAYRVVVPNVAPVAGFNPTYDEDGIATTGVSQTPVIAAGVEHLSADFGYNWVAPGDSSNPGSATTGAIGDRVWNDVDGDGVQDAGEAGIGGVTVRLLTDDNADGVYGGAGDNPATMAGTDSDGQYVFDGLPAGAYVVELDDTTLPAGIIWTQTGDPDGVLDDKTSAPVVLAPGDVYVNADFGYQPNQGSALGDRIYLDANGNGADDGEPGIPGVSVALVKDLDNDGQWDAGELVIATDITDANGGYLFDGLPAGGYLVVVTDSEHVLGELVQTGDPDGGNNGRSAATLDGVNDNLAQDHGYAPPGHQAGDGLLGDTVFLDRDNDGVFDAGEGLEGVKVDLYDDTNLHLGSTYTDENGHYAFGGLNPAGTYKVQVDTGTLSAGLANTVDPDGGFDDAALRDLTVTGPLDLTADFGYRAPAPNTLSGTLWQDRNADGTLDVMAETGRFADITVELLDNAGNVLGSTVTDANGDYSFPGLPDGTYKVHVTDTAGKLEGYWKTDGPNGGSDGNSQIDAYTVVLSGGQNTTGDFGYYEEGAALGNRVWRDADQDGIQDALETGINGALVSLTINYPNGAVTTLAITTDGNGGYRFGNLLLDESFDGQGPGEPTYSLASTTPAGYLPTLIGQGGDPLLDSNNPAGGTATVLKGQTDTGLNANPGLEPANAGYDFGYIPVATVTGHLYIDSNGDGFQGVGEPNLSDVDVIVTDSNGVPHIVTTDADGDWSATVPPGNTTADVDETDPEYPVGYVQTEGTDPTSVTALAGQTVSAGNDGYAPKGTVTGHLYIDNDGDGTQDPGEPNLPSVDVIVTDSNGVPHIVTTDADGNWSVTVSPGNTTADVDENDPEYPVGYVQTEGTDPTGVIALAGQTVSAGNDGYAPSVGTLTGHLYIDSDGDGTQDPGEPNLPNVDVIITDVNGGIHTATSDASGNWSAPGIPAGNASVNVDNNDPDFPAGYVQTEGTDPTAVTVPANGAQSAGIDGYAPSAELRIEKTASTDKPSVGIPFTYTLTVTNTGGPTTAPVQVIDSVPAGIKLTAVSATGWTCTPTVAALQPLQGSATLTCDYAGSMGANASRIITLTAVPTGVSGSYVNRATVTGDGDTPNTTTCDGTEAVNCGKATVTPKNPRIELIKRVALDKQNVQEDPSGDGLAQAGDKLTYTFTITNRGDVTLTAVSLVDLQLDGGTLSCAGTTAQGAAFSLGGSLAPNDSVVCTGKHTTTAAEASAGRIENTATATGRSPDGTPWQSVSNGDWDNAPPTGQISLTKTAVHNDEDGDGVFDQGETVTYQFIVRNVGTVALDGIVVSDNDLLFPPIMCPSSSLAVGAQFTCTTGVSDYVLTLADETAGKVLNTATVTGLTNPGGSPVASTDTKVLNSGQPAALVLKKTAVLTADADNDQALSTGDTLTYTLVATNTGGIALTNVTVADNKLGTALQTTGACSPQQGSTLNPGQQMVCTAAYTLQSGEANPIDNLANATGKPVGRLAPLDASANHVVPFTPPAEPVLPLYTVGNRVWMDIDDSGTVDAAEAGIDGVAVRLQRSSDGGANWTTAAYTDSSTIPDQVTSGGGYYQFANVPEGEAVGQPYLYRVQILVSNFKADIAGTKPLYGAVSSSHDAADFSADNRDQGLGTMADATYGFLSRSFDLSTVGSTTFNPVDFGFIKKTVAAPPDLVIVQSANTATVAQGGTLTYTLQASNAIGAGNLSTSPSVIESLPSGFTVTPGWPTVQPTRWSCTVGSTRQMVTCRYQGTQTGALPLAGGADLGGAIVIPVQVSAGRATGLATATASITKLTSEPSYTNNSAPVTVTVTVP